MIVWWSKKGCKWAHRSSRTVTVPWNLSSPCSCTCRHCLPLASKEYYESLFILTWTKYKTINERNGNGPFLVFQFPQHHCTVMKHSLRSVPGVNRKWHSCDARAVLTHGLFHFPSEGLESLYQIFSLMKLMSPGELKLQCSCMKADLA